ncbi:MAG: rod shape-determining protein MreB [Methylococcaceae bacterium]|nr:rod shape-determining protein MreB [Methylococcaceae bacterium]
MFKNWIKKLNTIAYVQIWENRIKVTDINTGNNFDEKPIVAIETIANNNKILAFGNDALVVTGENIEQVNPFSHPRTLLVGFTVAERLLQLIFKKIYGKRWFSPSPAIVVHLMEKTEGGLTQVEDRGFRELMVMSTGARKVFMYQGTPLDIEDFNLDAVKLYENTAY